MAGLVILAGLAAGLVTFVLTALIVDRAVARSTHQRWSPVTRLALTDILHALADDEASEVTHGKVVPRRLDEIETTAPSDEVRAALAGLRHDIIAEREQLARVLASWSSLLASSADATGVLDHAADFAERLDLVRDVSVTADGDPASAPDRARFGQLNREIALYNGAMDSLIAELRRLIVTTGRLASPPQR